MKKNIQSENKKTKQKENKQNKRENKPNKIEDKLHEIMLRNQSNKTQATNTNITNKRQRTQNTPK